MRFVRQLQSIGIGGSRLQYAKRDFYRASTQRSQWARQNLLFDGEVGRFERTLIEEWQPRFTQMSDRLAGVRQKAALREGGHKLYSWVETDARFPLRTEVSRFLNVGSYHILADDLRVGWHRDYETVCGDPDNGRFRWRMKPAGVSLGHNGRSRKPGYSIQRFCGELIGRTVGEYHRTRQAALSMVTAFLVLPLVLHRPDARSSATSGRHGIRWLGCQTLRTPGRAAWPHKAPAAHQPRITTVRRPPPAASVRGRRATAWRKACPPPYPACRQHR